MSKKKEAVEALTMFAVGAGGAILSSWALNMTPGVKTANPTTRSLAQLGVGLGLVLFMPAKNRMIRYASMGVAWAGALGAVERGTKMKTLAGNTAGTLSAQELAMLRELGGYHHLSGPATMRSMSGPATMRSMDGGRPSTMGGFKAPS